MSASLADLELPATSAVVGAGVRDHFARLDETKAERERVARIYYRLAKLEHARSQGYENRAGLDELREEKLVEAMETAAFFGDRPAFEAAWKEADAILPEIGRDEMRKLSRKLQLEAERYHKASDCVRDCASGLFARCASGCPSGCKKHVVSRCNRIGCPNCSKERASALVAEWAPRLADLVNTRVLMLSIPNVEPGHLDDGVALLLKAFTIMRKRAWFRSRWNAGVLAVETTVGRSPRGELGNKGWWHPHLHVIVGCAAPMEWPDVSGHFSRIEDLQREWTVAVELALVPKGTLRHRICPRCDQSCVKCGGRSWATKDRRPRDRKLCRCCGATGCPSVKEFTIARAEARVDAGKPYITWIDEPYYKAPCTIDGCRDCGSKDPKKRWHPVYERTARDEDDRRKIREHTCREAMKYISDGLPELSTTRACELIQAKERRRWLQGFGELHAQGVRVCRTCRSTSCTVETEMEITPGAPEKVKVPCAGCRSWRVKENDLGELCPCCKAMGETERELEEQEPAECEHGFAFDKFEFTAPPLDAWAALLPSGLMRPRRKPRGPPLTLLSPRAPVPF